MKGGAVLAAEKIKGGDEGAQIQRASKIEGFYCGFLGRPSGHAQIDSSTHQLHGIFEAASFGGTNIDPTAWEDKKNAGESRFPAQVRVVMRKICEPLEEDSFRPILHHYDGPKFRLELNIPEAPSLLDIFAENNASSSSCDVIN